MSASVGKYRGVVYLTALAVFVTGCGSSSHSLGSTASSTSPHSHQAVLTRVLEATDRLRSFSFVQTGRLQTNDPRNGVTGASSGVADVVAHLTEATLTVSNSSTRETVLIAGSRAYDRLPGPPPIGHNWCWKPTTKVSGPRVSATATLARLATSGRAVSEVGSAVVRGVNTTHYVVTGGSTSPVDIWVDGSDQLRRMQWTLTGPTYREAISSDLFDFNRPVRISVPAHAPACSY